MISSRLPADRSFDRSKYTEQHDIVPGAVNGWFTVPGAFFLINSQTGESVIWYYGQKYY